MHVPPFGTGYMATSTISSGSFLMACFGSMAVGLLGPFVLWLCCDVEKAAGSVAQEAGQASTDDDNDFASSESAESDA